MGGQTKADDIVKVSVVCMTYNHEKYIRKTLDGFVSQITDFVFQVIVHDDASTDSTADIVAEYAKKYPHIIIPVIEKENQYSKGEYADYSSINERVVGKYRAFCEGDDYWNDPLKLQKQYNAMERNPSFSMSVHITQYCTESGDLLQEFIGSDIMNESGAISSDRMGDLLWSEGLYPFHTSSFFVREDILRSVDYRTDARLVLKYDSGLLRLATVRGAIYYINNIMSIRRKNVPGSYNMTIKDDKEKQVERLIQDIEIDLKINELSDRVYNGKIKYSIFKQITKLALDDPLSARLRIIRGEVGFKEIKQYLGMGLRLEYIVLKCTPFMFRSAHKAIEVCRKKKKGYP